MNSGTGRGSSLAGSAGGAGGLCASPGTPGRGAPCPRFRTASLKKSSGAPGRQARSIKAAGAQRRKGPVCIPQTQKPLSRHSGRGGGGEGAESALEQCGQSGRGRPVGTKGPQCWRGGRPGAWWQHKGKLCPRSTQGHLCLPSPSQRKVTEGASRLSSLLRDLVTGMAKLFLQDAGNSDENSNVLACYLGDQSVFVSIAACSDQGQGREGRPV